MIIDSQDDDSITESSPTVPQLNKDKPVSRDSDRADDVLRNKDIRLSSAREDRKELRSSRKRDASGRNGERREKRTALNMAGTRHLIFDKEYCGQMTKLDVRGGLHDGQLVSYFTIMGMEDSDIVHTVMAVKEMLHAGYKLNDQQYDDLVSNAGILNGDVPYLRDDREQRPEKILPKFRAPTF